MKWMKQTTAAILSLGPVDWSGPPLPPPHGGGGGGGASLWFGSLLNFMSICIQWCIQRHFVRHWAFHRHVADEHFSGTTHFLPSFLPSFLPLFWRILPVPLLPQSSVKFLSFAGNVTKILREPSTFSAIWFHTSCFSSFEHHFPLSSQFSVTWFHPIESISPISKPNFCKTKLKFSKTQNELCWKNFENYVTVVKSAING